MNKKVFKDGSWYSTEIPKSNKKEYEDEYEAEIAQEIVETFHLQDLIKPLYEDTPISIKVRIDLTKVRKLMRRISKLQCPKCKDIRYLDKSVIRELYIKYVGGVFTPSKFIKAVCKLSLTVKNTEILKSYQLGMEAGKAWKDIGNMIDDSNHEKNNQKIIEDYLTKEQFPDVIEDIPSFAHNLLIKLVISDVGYLDRDEVEDKIDEILGGEWNNQEEKIITQTDLIQIGKAISELAIPKEELREGMTEKEYWFKSSEGFRKESQKYLDKLELSTAKILELELKLEIAQKVSDGFKQLDKASDIMLSNKNKKIKELEKYSKEVIDELSLENKKLQDEIEKLKKGYDEIIFVRDEEISNLRLEVDRLKINTNK